MSDSVKDQFTKAFQAWSAQERANRERNLDALAKKDEKLTVYFAIEKMNGKVKATAISGLPDPDKTLVTWGRTEDEALFEARHELLALAWHARMPGDDWSAIRYRVALADLIPSRIEIVKP